MPVLLFTNLQSKMGSDHWKPHTLFCNNNNWRWRNSWRYWIWDKGLAYEPLWSKSVSGRKLSFEKRVTSSEPTEVSKMRNTFCHGWRIKLGNYFLTYSSLKLSKSSHCIRASSAPSEQQLCKQISSSDNKLQHCVSLPRCLSAKASLHCSSLGKTGENQDKALLEPHQVFLHVLLPEGLAHRVGADSPATLSHLGHLLFFEGICNLSKRSFTGQLLLALQFHSHGREAFVYLNFQALPSPHFHFHVGTFAAL